MCKIPLFIPEFVVDNGSLVNDMDELALSSGGGIIDLFRRVLKFRVSRFASARFHSITVTKIARGCGYSLKPRHIPTLNTNKTTS